jgi:DNA-binding NarL/FixJ family response regulator
VDAVGVLDSAEPPQRVEPKQVVAVAHDLLTLHRMAAAIASAGLPAPARTDDIEEALKLLAANRHAPTLVVLGCDVSMPSCMAELRRLRKFGRAARLVVISPATDANGVRRALDAGADGVVFESELAHTLVPSLMAVAAGQVAVPRRLWAGLQKPAFSHREREVLAHVAAGLTNCEIAEALFLSESTVKSHLSSAFAKLGVRSRKEAAALVLDPEGGLRADLLAAGVSAAAKVRNQEAS